MIIFVRLKTAITLATLSNDVLGPFYLVEDHPHAISSCPFPRPVSNSYNTRCQSR